MTRRRPRWRAFPVLAVLTVVLGLLAWACIARRFAPTSNTSLTRFDAIIVLGFPADNHGNPTSEQLARVTEAVHEFKRGIALRLILTGGAARNSFVEARVMARSAEDQGIPESAIFVEPESLDTIHNACYAVRVMKNHAWHSAEIVSSARQLPRAGFIFSRLPLEWRTHTALPLSPQPAAYVAAIKFTEVLKTVRYLIWARWAEPCEP